MAVKKNDLLSILLFSMTIFHSTLGQDTGLCPDGQGVNVLTDGDFGFGMSNVLPNDPGIAPGYDYTTTPPPNDGFYTITNDMTPWGSFATNWIDIGDNSNDPDGYMMVVNASFEPGVFYEQDVDICSGSTYQFSADIINILEPSQGQQILPNVDFLVDNTVLYSTGDIPQDATWRTVGFTFTADPGQNSALIQIRNNAPGGQGNDLAIDNISFSACGPLLTISGPDFVCENAEAQLTSTSSGGFYSDPYYQWQVSPDGVSWMDIPGAIDSILQFTVTSDTFFRLLTSDGEDNIDLPTCRVNSLTFPVGIDGGTFRDTIELCDGDEIQLAEQVITTGGDYTANLNTALGCDSLVFLHVDLLQTGNTELFDTICIGESYNGEFYDESTVLTSTLTNSVGCDSTVTTNLFVDNIDLILPQSITIQQGQAVDLIPAASGEIVLWRWWPDTFISCIDCPFVTVNPPLSQSYSLAVESANGCTDTATTYVEVLFNRSIFFPTAFSPNNDGINDTYFPFSNQNIVQIDELMIFNRWGKKVYEIQGISSSDRSMAWDGTIRGKAAQEGVYVYYASATVIDGSKIESSGDFTLIR